MSKTLDIRIDVPKGVSDKAARFAEAVREVTDATRCEAAQVRPHYDGMAYELPLQFPPDEAPDGLHEFLERKRTLLQKLADDVATHDEHWKKVTAWERGYSSGL